MYGTLETQSYPTIRAPRTVSTFTSCANYVMYYSETLIYFNFFRFVQLSQVLISPQDMYVRLRARCTFCTFCKIHKTCTNYSCIHSGIACIQYFSQDLYFSYVWYELQHVHETRVLGARLRRSVRHLQFLVISSRYFGLSHLNFMS